MNLTRKQRMKNALQHEPVDFIPTQINYTSGMGHIMAKNFNIPVSELPAHLGNHMVRVDLDTPEQLSLDGKLKFDWWGVGFDTQEEGYFAAFNPLKENPDLDSIRWPDPNDPQLLLSAETTIKEQGDEFFITPNLGFALFERACDDVGECCEFEHERPFGVGVGGEGFGERIGQRTEFP